METRTVERSDYFSLDCGFIFRIEDPTEAAVKDDFIIAVDRLKQNCQKLRFLFTKAAHIIDDGEMYYLPSSLEQT